MKKFFYVAIAATALASCSSDNLVDLKEGDEIKFTAVADNDSRAADVYCNNNLPGEFKLWACYDDKESFINGETYTVDGSGVATNAKTRYWPEDGKLDFYALVNGEATLSTWPAAPTVKFDVLGNVGDNDDLVSVADQKDLLYAVTPNQSKTTDNVRLNFRHALSQIEFQAKNTNPQLYIEVTGVRVGKVNTTDTYNLPSTATNVDVYLDHDSNVSSNDRNVANEGKWTTAWTNSLLTLDNYEVSFSPIEITNVATSLTLSNDKVGVGNSLLLLPTIWDGNQTGTTAWTVTNGTYDGTYLAVKCTIWNVLGDAVDKDSDAILHDDAWAVIPVDFKWEEGKKYIYTFVFGTGSAGYEENSTDPVLWPIKLDISVDDFQPGETYDPDMDTVD